MAFEAEVTVVYYTDVFEGGGDRHTHVATGKLHDTVPEELGDVSYREYKHLAAQQILQPYMNEWVLIPSGDENEVSYHMVHRTDIVSATSRIKQTLDVV